MATDPSVAREQTLLPTLTRESEGRWVNRNETTKVTDSDDVRGQNIKHAIAIAITIGNVEEGSAEKALRAVEANRRRLAIPEAKSGDQMRMTTADGSEHGVALMLIVHVVHIVRDSVVGGVGLTP